ncbi:YybH family protein [Ancylomarina longa]|uniref:DUF4440 domain-containing protein n=1 Tax=Ancylomarina longa TaxID=2487017 RepID=A0A434AEI8_9BACT|nr:DUF4440 domain-containing protein [Ancylomarina longa]RUT72797.1 DUF4440 domain-containing protein [Ancylomarina longa]
MRSNIIYSRIGILLMLVILVSCVSKENFDQKPEIVKANQQFMDALHQGNAMELATLYTVDAQVMPPNHEIVTGTKAIQAFWQSFIDMGIKNLTLDIAEVESLHNTIIEVSKYTIKGDSANIIDQGKYIVIWKKENNKWKLHRDIFNSNIPLEPKVDSAE